MKSETDKISNNELIEIFNRVLDSCPCIIDPFSYRRTVIQRRRNSKQHKDYFLKKQYDIECKLEVFENIPKNKIYVVIEDFIEILESYNSSKIFNRREAKKLNYNSYKLIKKDIKIIEEYQEMIYHYSSDYEWNDDEDFSILNPVLEEIYQQNKLLLKELKTKKFNILDPFRYGGSNLYDSTKKPIKKFFKELQIDYNLKSVNIKQMIDIL